MDNAFPEQVVEATHSFRRYCIDEQRHRVAWLIGQPRSGKSSLAKRLATEQDWLYINYTLDHGYLDRLASTIHTYQPDDLLASIKQWCRNCDRQVLIIDEIDSLLATWSIAQRRTWASSASRLRDIPCGLILSTSLLDENSLIGFLPETSRPHIYVLPGVNR